MSLSLAVPAAILLLVCIHFQQVEATTYKGTAIGIVISESCLISPNCLNYSDIVELDNSDPIYSGAFIEKNGDMIRKCTSYQNNHQWLQYTKNYTIMVDPCLKYRDQIPIIEVYPQLDWYHTPGQMKIVEAKSAPDRTATHQILLSSKDRYVDATCTNAKITAKNWQVILLDTINYLRTNCDPSVTHVESITVQFLEKTTHDISTSQKYKDEKKLEWIKANCLKSFGACPELGVTKLPSMVTQPIKKVINHYVLNLVE